MKNLILFASGRGSNVEAIIAYFKNHEQVNIQAVVCNKPNIGAIDIANANNIPIILIPNKAYYNSIDFVQQLQNLEPDLIVLAGFLWKIPDAVVTAFPNKIINLHPALLPKYGGKGMYGHFVHEAVLANKDLVSGITIHYVNEHYDEGQTIVQASVAVKPDDNVDTLAQRIGKAEHFYLPRTIEFLLFKQ